jgi:hypothetical protein
MSTRTSVLIAVIAFLTSITLIAASHPAPAAPVAGWEYLVVRGGIDIAASPKDQEAQIGGMQGTLNNLGNEGWELSAVQGQFAVLKRPR